MINYLHCSFISTYIANASIAFFNISANIFNTSSPPI